MVSKNKKSKQYISCKFYRAHKHSCRSDDSHDKAGNAYAVVDAFGDCSDDELGKIIMIAA